MPKVRKSDIWRATHAPDAEPHQEFDRRKIEMALVRAGATAPDVEEIAAMIKPHEGMTTNEIDEIVLNELKKRDPVAAKYWQIKRENAVSRFRK